MELAACPLHEPLGAYCARIILKRHRPALPDLTAPVILVPDATGARALRSELLRQARQQDFGGLLLPEILTLHAWACRHYSGTHAENHLSELLELALALRNTSVPPLKSQGNPWTIAGELLRLFDELELSGNPVCAQERELTEQLQQAYGIPGEPPGQLGMEARIVHALWQVWNRAPGASLSSGKYYRMALDELPTRSEAEAVYVCGYERLKPVEIQALAQISAAVPVTVVTRPKHFIPGSDARPDDAEPPSPYAAVLQCAFDTAGGSLPDRARACRKRYPEDPLQDKLRILAAEQAEPHARAVETQIRRWLLEGRRRIGLVTEDRKLARRVRALLERAGIFPVDDAGWALSTTSAASAVVHWLACLEQDFHYRTFLDVLKSPFVCPLPAVDDYPERVGALERLLYRKNAHSSLNHYRKIAGEHPELLELLEAAAQAARPLLELKDSITGGTYLKALLDSLERLGCPSRLADDEAGEEILDLFAEMRVQLGGHTAPLAKRQWPALIRQLLERRNFKPQSSQSAVALINLHQAHLACFECLIVAGMDARHYPAQHSAATVFNDAVRAELDLPTDAERRTLDLQRFLALILAADRVLLTYQKNEQDEPLLPSAWWEQIVAFHRQAYPGSVLEDASLQALLDPQGDACVRPAGPPVRTHALAGMPHPAARPELLPSKISAGGHQDLIDCPYRFYVRRMLALSAVNPINEEMDNVDFGQFVHDCLEAFHTDVPNLPGPWTGPLARDERSALELLVEIGNTAMAGLGDGFANRVFGERWNYVARRYVRMQKALESEREIVRTEFTDEAGMDAELALQGRIDRVDRTPDGRHIVIDYKTGSQSISERDIQTGEQVQLTSYALLLDAMEQVEYWWLNQGHKERTCLAGEELVQARDNVRQRLIRTFQRLRQQAELPAHGDERTCAYCDAQGICRKEAWAEGRA